MKKTLLLMGLLFSVLQVFSQRTITGKVTDEKDGTPLSGVSVTVKGTSIGTVTGTDGSFSLSVPASAKLSFFHLLIIRALKWQLTTGLFST